MSTVKTSKAKTPTNGNSQEEEIKLEFKKLESDVQDNENNGFKVDDDSKASWCLRKIKKMKKKQQDNEELAQDIIERLREEIKDVESWLKGENDKIQNNIDFLEGKLREYAFNLREEDPDLKTYSLPYGKLKFRKRRPKWKYDEDKLLDFVENNFTEALKIKKKVSKRTLKKKAETAGDKAVLKDTGEIIEGVTIEKRPEKFKVDVDM